MNTSQKKKFAYTVDCIDNNITKEIIYYPNKQFMYYFVIIGNYKVITETRPIAEM